MARETDYVSQFSYQLYDTTGTTDDYIYDGLGGFSYTPEIGKNEFHPEFTTGSSPSTTAGRRPTSTARPPGASSAGSARPTPSRG
jgi:hypothetical protein